MVQTLFEQELDFSRRLPFDHFPRYAARYLKAWRIYWRNADLVDESKLSKANLIYKRSCQIAIEYGLCMSVHLDQYGVLKMALKFPFSATLSSVNRDSKRLCNAMLVCDEFAILPQGNNGFDLVFTLYHVY